MEKTFTFSLILVLVGCVYEISGKCVQISDGQYSCEGGKLTDLEKIPDEAGVILIKYMNIEKLPANAIKRFGDYLELFQCSYCGIREIEPGTFQPLNNLQQLILDNNHLTSVKADWFSGPLSLTYIDLTYNEITNIEDKVFTYISDVTDLRLAGNLIECIDTKALSNLKYLKRINLAEIPNFKCPHTASEFLREKNVKLETDQTWDKLPMAVEEEFLHNQNPMITEPVTNPTVQQETITTTPFTFYTRPQHLEIPKSTETLLPKVTSEDVDIYQVLKISEKPIQTSSEVIDTSSVVTVAYPRKQGEQTVTVTTELSSTTQFVGIRVPDKIAETPTVITPSAIPVVFYTPKPTERPILGPKVLPTSGEGTSSSSANTAPSEYHAVPTNTTHNVGANSNIANGYLIGIIVAMFCRSF